MQTNNLQEVLINKINQFLALNSSTPDKLQIEGKSAELTAISKDPHFVNIVHHLLTNEQSTFNQDRKEKQMLMTSLLKDKFKFEFESMSQHVELHYRQLIQIAQKLKKPTYATYTNIALSLAYTYIHLLARQPTSLPQFLRPLEPAQEDQTFLYNFYYKTLEYIATEIDNNKFVIDDLQRETAHQRLVAQQLTVLQGLNVIAQKAFEIKELDKDNILYCFQAWITVHYNPEVLNSLAEHTLFQQCLAHLQDLECGEAAGNCIRSIIFQLKNQQENRPLFQTLSNCSLQIVELAQQYLDDGDVDRAEDFIKILTDFTRKSRKMFVANYDRQYIGPFLLKLIHYLGDSTLSNIYEPLSDAFEGILKHINECKQKGLPFKSEFFQLMDPLYCALVNRCQLTNSLLLELNHTDESKTHHISSSAQRLFKHRQFTQAIFQVMVEVQTKPVYVKYVLDKMTALSPQEGNFWPRLQVYLYSLMDAFDEYPTVDNSAVSIVKMHIELSSHGQPLPICVTRAFLRVFRGLATCPQKQEELNYRIMCTATGCFHEPLLSTAAEKTFEQSCKENKHIATKVYSQFHPIIHEYPHRAYIIHGLVILMCHDSGLTQQNYLPTLNFLFSKFRDENEKSRRKEYMHSIIQAVKAFQDSPMLPHHKSILTQFVRQNWTVIKTILGEPKRVKDDEDSNVEKIVRILKIIMRTLQFDFSQFLEEMFTLVLTAFQKHPICSYVYLVEVAVTVYSSNPNYTDYLRRLYSDFCDIAFKHMARINDLDRFSYLLDDFMGMNKRFFLYNASIVLSSGKLPTIIDTCISHFMGCSVPRVAKAGYSFFQTIFMVYWPTQHLNHRNSKEGVTPFNPKPEDGRNYQELKQFLLQKMERIVSKMLEHLSCAPTEQTRDYILDSLVSQIKAFVGENPPIWRGMLSQISSEVLVQQEKDRMVEMLQSLNGLSFEESRKKIKHIDKMLVLMNRRMDNANNRRNALY